MQSLQVLGCRVDLVDARGAVTAVLDAVHSNRGAQVVTLGTEMVVYAQRDARFREVVNGAALCVCDTIGLLKVVQARGANVAERVTGIELLEALCERAARESISVYLLGAAPGVAERAAQELAARYPGLPIAGVRNGYFGANESAAIADEIRASGARLLFVGLGFPRQEFWLAKHLPTSGCGAGIGVGGSFDAIAGVVPRAPAAWRRVGVEWLYRLLREPKRWRRQLALPQFVFLVFADGLRSRLKRGKT